jgi:ubiquinone/menaquinone biosynthesis C-methylase UbiE
MIYQHPLAYLLGIEGIGLLRAFRGEFDREFVAARLAEARRLLDDESLADAGVEVDRVGTVDGYRLWSTTYDDPGNAAFDIDMRVVKDILDGLPVGVALDAACGTGRLTRELADRGHRVVGVDSSPDMLARARERMPNGEFLAGELHALPVPDDHVDLVVCGLALSHVPELGPVLAEFARVLRPGGHLVITDMHPESVLRGAIPAVRDQAGRPGRLVSHRHLVGDYLRAALAAGLVPRRGAVPLPARPVRPGTRLTIPVPGSCGRGVWPRWCPKRHTRPTRACP